MLDPVVAQIVALEALQYLEDYAVIALPANLPSVVALFAQIVALEALQYLEDYAQIAQQDSHKLQFWKLYIIWRFVYKLHCWIIFN